MELAASAAPRERQSVMPHMIACSLVISASKIHEDPFRSASCGHAVRGGAGPGLPRQGRASCRSLRRRRQRRYFWPHPRAEARRRLQTAFHRRESRRGERRHRYGFRSQSGARRLHAARDGERPDHGESGPLRQGPLRPGQGPRPGRAVRRIPVCAGDPGRFAGQEHLRPGRGGAREAGRGFLRVHRGRRRQPSRRRAARARHPYPAHARPLQGQRARARGPAGRPAHFHVRHRHHLGSADSRRKVACVRGVEREARLGPPGGADHAGGRDQGLRHLAVAGRARAGRNVQGDRRSPQPGDRQGDARARRARAPGHPGRQRNRDRQPGGPRRADQERFTAVCETGEGREDPCAMKILVLPGDGIGPEITAATLTVLERANALFKLELRWQHEEIGLPALKKEGTTLPPRALEAARSSDGVILGPLSTYEYPTRDKGGINPSAELRTKLDLYANIRPARSRMGVGLTGKPVDLVIYRENTEGFYADRNMHVGIGEFMPTEDMALAVRRVTAKCCERIARRAFEAATTRRGKVTAIHKANVFRISDGLWLREVRKVAVEFPGVQLEEVIVDAMAALLLRDPMRFDVIVAENMYGDILSDEASELSGGLGLGGSINAGDAHCLAQAQHGSAPDLAGKNRANPTSLILSAAMLLEWIAARRGNDAFAAAARNIDAAVDATLNDPATRTADLGGKLGTGEFAKTVAAKLG